MKRIIKRVNRGLLVACAVLLCISQNVFAAEDTDGKASYSYTVTIYAGNQGYFVGTDRVQVSSATATKTSSGDRIQITGLKYGDEVRVYAADNGMVSLTDSGKYYVRGIRKSGRDNSTVEPLWFKVTSDMEYVMAYGIKGSMVSYTVNYLDDTGNALLESQTYYGNVGDQLVVAYQDIEGYLPQAYNLRKTLLQNEAENVFSFIYHKVATQPTTTEPDNNAGSNNGTGGNNGTAGDNGAADNGAAGANGANGTADGNGTAAGNGNEPAGGGAQTDEAESTVIEPEDVPQGEISLDDEKIPEAGMPDADASSAIDSGSGPMPIYIAIAVTALVALGVLIWAVRKKRKA